MRKYKIKSELSEKQIEADVASYFGWLATEGALPLRLLDINEQSTGADKRANWIIPIYMQFKVSQGLKSVDEAPISYREKLLGYSPLNRIRKFRSQHGLYDNPTLYFKLRDIASSAEDFQHNVLLKFANNSFSQACYVSPLILDMEGYFESLHEPVYRNLDTPFFWDNISIHQKDWVSYINKIPFIRNHISIIPHETVNTADHYYSFSSTGTEVGWHSPGILPDKAYRLSDMLIYLIRSNVGFHIENNNEVRKLCDIAEIAFDENKDTYENLVRIGKHLNKEYSIRQFLLTYVR